MFYLTGIIVTFFLAFILVGKKGKTEADRILAQWLIATGFHQGFFYLFITGQSYSVPQILGLEMPFPFLHGPFLYLYTASLTNQITRGRVRLLHFLPFLLCYAWIMPFLFAPAEHKVFVYQNKGLGYENLKGIMMVGVILSGIIYVGLSLRLLNRHKRNLRDQFSYAEKINLGWLRYLIFGIGIIWLAVIWRQDTAVFSTVVLFVILLGYFGIKQVGIFTQATSSPTEPDSTLETTVADELQKPKYQKSSLDPSTAENIHQALNRAMGERKLFTNPELSLADLAKELHVHPNHLSQVINTYEQKSFYDYINALRIEEFKRVAGQPESQKFTLLGLAHNCGFNSKTSFNRNFKNATGLSPSEYLKQAHILLEG